MWKTNKQKALKVIARTRLERRQQKIEYKWKNTTELVVNDFFLALPNLVFTFLLNLRFLGGGELVVTVSSSSTSLISSKLSINSCAPEWSWSPKYLEEGLFNKFKRLLSLIFFFLFKQVEPNASRKRENAALLSFVLLVL